MVNIIPLLDIDQQHSFSHTPSADEVKTARRVHPRIQHMLDARTPFVPGMKRALLNYEGISRENPEDPRDEVIVMPLARAFVEAKTSEEVKAQSEYEFTPIEDSADSWKVDLIKDVNVHVQRKIKFKARKQEMLRMKNLMGVGIGRLGYRRVMRRIKERVPEEDTGLLLRHIEHEVPIYDDLFMELISPLDFGVDPNATSMDDAMDCVHIHAENYEVFLEVYGLDKRFTNIEAVQPGKAMMFNADGSLMPLQNLGRNLVYIYEYFNKMRDEWIIYANGIEIYNGPLPDDHKMLPFVSYHNSPSFVTTYVNYMFAGQRSPNSGKEVSYQQTISSHPGFWSKGDPEILRDLIELYTGLSRAQFRREKLAGEIIVATANNARFQEKGWRTGDQAVGMMGKFEVKPLATSEAGNREYLFDKIMEMCILAIGVDPRNLSEDKPTKTATEAAIMRETAMKRLEMAIEYNEEHGDVRMGEIIFKLIQQYYTKPEIVRLTGLEDAKQLDSFDKIEKDPNTGRAMVGMKYRRIRSKENFEEEKNREKYRLHGRDSGVSSFIARPEYIRTSDVDISIASGREIGQSRAIKLQQTNDAMQLYIQLYQLAIPQQPGQPATLSMDDLPDPKYLVEQHMKALGFDPKKSIGKPDATGDPKLAEAKTAMQQYAATRRPLNAPPPMQPQDVVPQQREQAQQALSQFQAAQ